jgi:hypothetical protein
MHFGGFQLRLATRTLGACKPRASRDFVAAVLNLCHSRRVEPESNSLDITIPLAVIAISSATAFLARLSQSSRPGSGETICADWVHSVVVIATQTLVTPA